MKIIWSECKKILNFKILIILGILTILYNHLYLNMFDDSIVHKYYIELYSNLVEKFGTSLTMEQYDNELQEYKLQLIKERDMHIRKNKVFQDRGINNREELMTMYDEIHKKSESERTEQDEQFLDELTKFDFLNDETSKLAFQIQEFDRMDECRHEGKDFGQTKECVEKIINSIEENKVSDSYKKRRIELGTRKEISLIYDYVVTEVSYKFVEVAKLIMICCLIVIIPYQIKERMNQVMPIYASTKTGRKLFSYQIVAVIFSCTAICVFQFILYAIRCYLNNCFAFWNCNVNGTSYLSWVDITFGQQFLLYLFLIWIVNIAISLVAYLVSRIASNYVIGIAVIIPIGVCCSRYINISLRCIYVLGNYYSGDNRRWIHWTVCIMLLIVGIIVMMFNKKDRIREIV